MKGCGSTCFLKYSILVDISALRGRRRWLTYQDRSFARPRPAATHILLVICRCDDGFKIRRGWKLVVACEWCGTATVFIVRAALAGDTGQLSGDEVQDVDLVLELGRVRAVQNLWVELLCGPLELSNSAGITTTKTKHAHTHTHKLESE